MPLTQRCHSVNTYCLHKIWFKCASIDLRVLDISKITSNIKSLVYADQLEKPEEIVLYRRREAGGLQMINVKYKAMAELIKAFLDTSINPNFIRNIYHRALYDWHVEEIRTIPDPGHFTKNCKKENKHPNVDWEKTWPVACMQGLESDDCTFLWRITHNLLPTQDRLNRILASVQSPICTLCDSNVVCDLTHALFFCRFNNDIGNWLIRCLSLRLQHVQPQQLITLDLHLDSHDIEKSLPAVWLTAKTLGEVWQCRLNKKQISIFTTRAILEANIMLLRKTRFKKCAENILNLIITK